MATSINKLAARKQSSRLIFSAINTEDVDEEPTKPEGLEDIPAEECRENKVYRINTVLEGAASNAVKQGAATVASGINVVPLSSRSGDANKK